MLTFTVLYKSSVHFQFSSSLKLYRMTHKHVVKPETLPAKLCCILILENLYQPLLETTAKSFSNPKYHLAPLKHQHVCCASNVQFIALHSSHLQLDITGKRLQATALPHAAFAMQCKLLETRKSLGS